MKCDDFRNIAISPIISEVFEYCLVERFSDYLVCSDNQFGFKKGLSCNHAVYSTRRIVESIVSEVTQLICVLWICPKHSTK